MPEFRERSPAGHEAVILREATENTNEGFVTIDQDHRVIIFNKAAEKIFGYTRDEVIGKDLGAILSPECEKGHKVAVARFLQTREPRLIGHQTEFMTRRKNGEWFPLSISFSVSEIDGRFYFTAIVRDMTETKALQEQVLRSERLAALGQLVAEITHEIKNPLVMIGGYARQLARTVEDEKSRSKLEIITDEVGRLEKLLQELREIYRPQPLVLQEVDVNVLLSEIYSLAKEDCRLSRIDIRLDTPAQPLWIKGDSEKLKQVFLNLVKNAMEAMEKGGTLTIRSRPVGEEVEVAVQDDGPGIRAEDRAKLFTPFFTTKRRGSGLGLSVSKRIVEGHPGGRLELESEEGKGTLVRILLPLIKVKEGERGTG